MKTQTDWLKILIHCKDNVKTKIRPHLATLCEPQPDLGRGAGGDLIKPIDLIAEKAIVEVLQQYCTSFTLISEESGVKEFGENPENFYVTLDPIDGTTNMVRGLPFYASSIAISTMPALSKIFAALVTDLSHDTMYTALGGRGAYCKGKRITSSACTSLEDAMIGLDLNTYKIQEILPQITNLIQKTKHIRHFGANALELCYVADGSTDAFVDIRGKLRVTDMAAGFLILKEAGGIITAPEGYVLDAKLDPKQKIEFIASGNKKIHKNILSLVKPKC